MSKIAFVFPGQGAQYVGMGRDFYEHISASHRIFEEASNACGLDLAALCFTENENLNLTKYTQIAMLTTEAAILEAVKELGIRPDVTAGLSLGEYGALVASGVMGFSDAAKIVKKRGAYMQEAVPEGGAMSAVLGLDKEKIEKALGIDGASAFPQAAWGKVFIANYNCPGQVVITGEAEAVEKAGGILKEAGAKRVLPLKVSGPFHSPLLRGAGEKLGEALTEVPLFDFAIPYVSNVTADYVKDTSPVKELLKRQVSSSVRWQQSVERMLADGVDTFLEIGPGHTLTGFLRKIDRNARGISVEKLEDLEGLCQKLDAIHETGRGIEGK